MTRAINLADTAINFVVTKVTTCKHTCLAINSLPMIFEKMLPAKQFKIRSKL